MTDRMPIAVGSTQRMRLACTFLSRMAVASAAQALALAGQTGQITYLDDGEVAASAPVQDYYRAWPMWREKALAALEHKNQQLCQQLFGRSSTRSTSGICSSLSWMSSPISFRRTRL